jgi:hypothetical protein
VGLTLDQAGDWHRTDQPLAVTIERPTGGEKDPRLTAADFCSQAKMRSVDELVAGRRSLLEAAEAFHVLDEANPNFNWRVFDREFPGKSVTEKHCREVILWTFNHTANDEPTQLQTRDRLERGLTNLFSTTNNYSKRK